MTVLNIVLNVVLIRGLGPIPAFGTMGAAMGTAIASGLVGALLVWKLWRGGWVVSFPRGQAARRPTGRSSGRCSASACRLESKASR